MFLAGLRVMFRDFDSIAIESVHINRAVKVQPLQVLDYSRLVPTITTGHPGFFVLNTSQFASNTLNNNEVIRCVDEFVRRHSEVLTEGRARAGSPSHDTTFDNAEQVL
jgi:hypothetical protein